MTHRQITSGGATALPLALIAQAVPLLSRHELESLTERLIDRLDELQGDVDLEDSHDQEAIDEREEEPCYGDVGYHDIDQRFVVSTTGLGSRQNVENFPFR